MNAKKSNQTIMAWVLNMVQDPFAPYMVDVGHLALNDIGFGNGFGLDSKNTTYMKSWLGGW